MPTPINYITEQEALTMLGYGTVEHLRKVTRNLTIPVRRAKLNRTTFLYSKTDIETYIQQKFHEKPVHKKTAVATAV